MEHISKALTKLNHQDSEASVDEVSEIEKYYVDKSSWVASSGIPLRFRGKDFSNYEVNKNNELAFNMSKKYAEEIPLKTNMDYKSLGLYSKEDWGVGKTHLVCAIAKRLIERCRNTNPVLYITEPDMLLRLRGTFNRQDSAETETIVYKELTTIPVLIVDDVGKEDVADPRFVQRVWFYIINTRYNNLLPVIITSNLTPDGIAHYLGGSRGNEATADRLYEMLNGEYYEIKGERYKGDSYRRKLNSGSEK